jgi:hypothetical protein
MTRLAYNFFKHLWVSYNPGSQAILTLEGTRQLLVLRDERGTLIFYQGGING